MRGSSPRGRGKRVNERSAPNRPGLIPAWAGKTDTPTRLAAHVPGSSPRGRGKRPQDGRHRVPGRLIPAWAGKTPAGSRSGSACRAHPRVGGENLNELREEVLQCGSSPRGRGKPAQQVGGDSGLRLIPAWAGKTVGLGASLAMTWAHPRVGGENPSTTSPRAAGSGSSPRGRGKQSVAAPVTALRRLIPAWAGKTRLCSP